MTLKSKIYNQLPKRLRSVVRESYYTIFNNPNKQYHSEFVEYFFKSQNEYEEYTREFESGGVRNLRNRAINEYKKMTGAGDFGGIGLDTAKDYYAITRKLKPTTVIETGVCNGMSTLSILLALQENNVGNLYSIDYPYRAEESLEQFRENTFKGYGGAAIPSDKEPGWIIPHELRQRWDLTIGKSQRELPELLMELENIDLFIHDSEHSFPCMMFEYELAYEWLPTQGVILSDDITWNEAFSVFTENREPEYGRISTNVGYMKKS